MTASQKIDAIIDTSRVSMTQVRVFVICVLITFLDGIDAQSIAIVLQPMGKEFALSKTALGLILSVMQLGSVVGGLVLGAAADRIGRKPTIVIALVVVSIFTFLTAVDQPLPSLLLVRFLAGMGLAGAIPAVLALSSEYGPSRLKGAIVAIVGAGYPLGAAAGAFLGGYLTEHHGWRWVFYAGALLPFIALLIIVPLLPESPRFLANRGLRSQRVIELMRKISPGAALPRESDLAAVRPPTTASRVPMSEVRQLLAHDLRPVTIAFWVLCFLGGTYVRMLSAWLPTLMIETGFQMHQAAGVLTVLNLACTLGMAIAGTIMDRLGTARTLVPAFVGCALAVAALSATHDYNVLLVIGAAVGFLLGMGASGTYVIGAHIYAANIRSTGLGSATAVSRVGTVVGPLLVSTMLGLALPVSSIYSAIAVLSFASGMAVLFIRPPAPAPRHFQN